MNWTPATPTSSEAPAVTVMAPETVEPDEGEVMLTVGGVVSGRGVIGTVTKTERELGRLPAASGGRGARVWDPLVAEVGSKRAARGSIAGSAQWWGPCSRT